MEEKARYELNLKVAELCPDIFEVRETHRGGKLVQYLIRKGDEDLIEVDPFNDLNACASFEATLDRGQRAEYVTALWEVTGAKATIGLILATAEQRCLAFVKTMEGK